MTVLCYSFFLMYFHTQQAETCLMITKLNNYDLNSNHLQDSYPKDVFHAKQFQLQPGKITGRGEKGVKIPLMFILMSGRIVIISILRIIIIITPVLHHSLITFYRANFS